MFSHCYTVAPNLATAMLALNVLRRASYMSDRLCRTLRPLRSCERDQCVQSITEQSSSGVLVQPEIARHSINLALGGTKR